MQALRQFGMAIAISVVSLGLVVGGLSLALSENFTPPPATEEASQPTAPALLTATATPQILPTGTLPPTVTNTALPPSACTPPAGWAGVLVAPNDTLASVALRYKTTSQALVQGNCLLTETLLAGTILFVPPVAPTLASVSTSTAISCGAPFAWVRYVVQPGDTLYHIATSYGITTSQLQRANCLGFSTTIRIGQLLWVPNVPTHTPGVTLAPTFGSPSPVPTEPLTETPLPDTETPLPDTETPEPTSTPVPAFTVTPVTPPAQ